MLFRNISLEVPHVWEALFYSEILEQCRASSLSEVVGTAEQQAGILKNLTLLD